MKKEIGSEFHSADLFKKKKKKIFAKLSDYVLTFSGRTAIETVILNEPSIKTVMIPSYCCSSMLEPFINNKINIKYYSVDYKNEFTIKFEDLSEVDAILWCNYFGYHIKMPELTNFKARGGIVIEDITHSLFSKEIYNWQSDYVVASLRKWLPLLSGGYCGKIKGTLNYKPNKYPSEKYLNIKRNAMDLKKQYLNGAENIDKNIFLNLFTTANKWIEKNYSRVVIDDFSKKILENIDYDTLINKRYENAKIIIEGLKDCKCVEVIESSSERGCPLFIPIMVKYDYRDDLRNVLISKNVYCPVHWPRPNEHCCSNFYDSELSLICDQRYDGKDMNRIVGIIKEWDEKRNIERRGICNE